MNFVNMSWSRLAFFLLLLAIPFVTLNMEKKATSEAWFTKPFSYVAGLIQSGLFSFTDEVRGTTRLYLNLIDIKSQNRDLKVQNQELAILNSTLKDLQIENARLSSLLGFQQKSKMQMVAAQVMSRDLMPDHSTLQVNKGTRDGLQAGQAVITVDGVLGYVFRPQLTSAHVLLITDRYSVVDTRSQRTRSRGLVEGKDKKTCVLSYIDFQDDLRVGDLMVTSGLDHIFPRGFPVAVVEKIEKKSFAVSALVELKPVVNSSRVEEVFVIQNSVDADYTSAFANGGQ